MTKSHDGRQSVCKPCSHKRNAKGRKEWYQKWYQANRAKKLKAVSIYNKENPTKTRARSAKRYATKINATPKWLSESQKEEINKIYANVPAGHQVDHIIPLKGKDICGLHVPWNLQYLPIIENQRKGNRY